MQHTDAIEGFLEWQRSAKVEECRALIAEAGHDDVLLGRGTSQAKRPANARYRLIVEQNRERYFAAATAEEKREITEQMVAEIGGRMLRRAGGGAGSSGWIEVKGEEARVKVAQALQYQQRHAKRSGGSGSGSSSSGGYCSDGSGGKKAEMVLSETVSIRKSRSLPPPPTTSGTWERGRGLSLSLLMERSVDEGQRGHHIPNQALPFSLAVRKSKSDSDVATTTASSSDIPPMSSAMPWPGLVELRTTLTSAASQPSLHNARISSEESRWTLHNHPINVTSRYNPTASVETTGRVFGQDVIPSSSDHFFQAAPQYPSSSSFSNVQQNESLSMPMAAASMRDTPIAGILGTEIAPLRPTAPFATAEASSSNDPAVRRMSMESFNMDNIRSGGTTADDEEDDCCTIDSDIFHHADESESGLNEGKIPARPNRQEASSGNINSGSDDDIAMAFNSLLSFDGFVDRDLDDTGIDTTTLTDALFDASAGDDWHDVDRSIQALLGPWTETEAAALTAPNATVAVRAFEQTSDAGAPPLSTRRSNEEDALDASLSHEQQRQDSSNSRQYRDFS